MTLESILMYQLIQAGHSDQLAQFCTPPGLPALNPEAISGQQADAHWLLADAYGDIVARCSLWWRATPPYLRQRLGLIGHYAAGEAEAAAQLLTLASDRLAGQGCTMAVGPMDGNTWQRYRLITERGSDPPFFLEPDNPDDWPAQFTDNGFSVLANYISTINTDLNRSDLCLSKIARRAANRGIHIRSLRLDKFAEELHQIYQIAIASFNRSYLYSPIGEADFIAMYHPLQPYIQPELILIAERKGQPIGFIFAIPDLLQAENGQAIDTVIIKTVAVHPDHQTAGLGSLLVNRCQEIAHKSGYKRAIHALMHDKNVSRKISRRYQTQMIRRYVLFAKKL